MSNNDIFGLAIVLIGILGVIAYGIVMIKTVNAIHNSRKRYYQYLKERKNYSVIETWLDTQ